MREPRFFSLTFRHVTHLVGVGAFLSVLMIWYASYQQKQIVLGEMEQRARLLCESLAGSCGLRYFLGDLKEIRYAFDATKEITDVASVTLLDKEGKPQVPGGLPHGGLQLSEILGARKVKVWRDPDRIQAVAPLTIRRQRLEDVTDMLMEPGSQEKAPESEILGYIHVTMSLARTNAYIRKLILRSIAATLIIIAFGSALAFYFFRKAVLRPIQNLAQGMTEARSGHLEARLEVVRRDEIGMLSRAFNEMVENLKKAQDDLMRSNLKLEIRVQERTGDLEQALTELHETHDKMLRTQKLAAIGQLASGVGHELRNPLGAIANAVYYIRDALKNSEAAKKDPALNEFLDVTGKEIRNCMAIINDLRDYSQVGKLTIETVPLNEVLKSAKGVVDFPENIRLIESYAESMPDILADPQRMRQVFVNLFTNAIGAMPQGGQLEVTTCFKNGGALENRVFSVAFKDTGQGISEENLKRIFEPLFTTKPRGTGLGLAICQGIVESHGGKIQVETAPGKGSTFTVLLSGSDPIT